MPNEKPPVPNKDISEEVAEIFEEASKLPATAKRAPVVNRVRHSVKVKDQVPESELDTDTMDIGTDASGKQKIVRKPKNPTDSK